MMAGVRADIVPLLATRKERDRLGKRLRKVLFPKGTVWEVLFL